MSPMCIEALGLMKGLIFSPVAKLNRIKEGVFPKDCIYILLALTTLVTFLKALSAHWNKSFNVFNGQNLDQIIIFLNNPFIMWAVGYLLYFCSIFLIDKLSRLFQPNDHKAMRLMLFAVSSIGLVAHALFYVLGYLVSKDVLTTIATFIYVWNLILVFLAVKIGSVISFGKALVVTLIPLAIFALSPFGIWSFMSPYLLFLF